MNICVSRGDDLCKAVRSQGSPVLANHGDLQDDESAGCSISASAVAEQLSSALHNEGDIDGPSEHVKELHDPNFRTETRN